MVLKPLRRVPGKPIVVEFSIARALTPPRADPNSYYVTLGLSPRYAWSDTEIKQAFRNQAKRVHPDGTHPDAVAYDRLQVAYQVLSDPDLRRKYDALDATQMWKDKDVVAAIIRRVAKARLKGGEMTEIAPTLREVFAAPMTPPGPMFGGWAYYHYDGEAVPDEAVRNHWIELLQGAAWGLDAGPEIKVGFTEIESHVVHKPWGDVLMASGDPSTEIAYELVELLNDSHEFGPHTDS